jgi:hypothetical protein
MTRTFKETLDQFGLDPARIVDERQELVRDTNASTFDATSSIVQHALDFCEKKGFGSASKLYVLQGAAEAGLYAVAISCTYPPDLHELKRGIPQDSLLFAGLLLASVCDLADDGHNINTAHAMFEQITGRGFRDCFIETCGCKHCRARRKRHGIAFNPDKQGNWI